MGDEIGEEWSWREVCCGFGKGMKSEGEEWNTIAAGLLVKKFKQTRMLSQCIILSNFISVGGPAHVDFPPSNQEFHIDGYRW